MNEIVAREKYVMTDVEANNNKVWEVILHANGEVFTRNGRIGSEGQQRSLGFGGRPLMDRKIREKTRKGYEKIDIVDAQVGPQASTETVKRAALDQIAGGCPTVSDLVGKLIRINRHQILAASGGQMDVSLDDGVVRTPVGVVTAENVRSARDLLIDLAPKVERRAFDDPDFILTLNRYLMLVPQKVGAKRGWHHEFMPDHESLLRQSALLDQLEGSIEIARKALDQAREKAAGETPKIFDVRMALIEDGSVIDRITRFYRESLNTRHSSAHLRPQRVFSIDIATMSEAFRKDGEKIGNVRELWHGTRAHNLLSILKGGLIIPRSGGSIHVTGRMFGDGLYFSDQSTKSLNYAYGYWDGGSRDDTCYMFLADVAMGREYTPRNATYDDPLPAGYDSTFAVGGRSGVHNNEMIVYRTGQARLKYLIEFGKGDKR